MYEDRIKKAVELFMSGYNCSQSVVAAFADLYGLSFEQALHVAASFGGGIGRMRRTCGAACGMFLLAGMDDCALTGEDREGKSRNYAVVQAMEKEFTKINGSSVCAELLGLRKDAKTVPQAEARDTKYYANRPCAIMVESAARIFAEYLQNKSI